LHAESMCLLLNISGTPTYVHFQLSAL
jgi:hypothetical protein